MSCKKCNQSNEVRYVVWDGKPGVYHLEVNDYDSNVYGIRYCPFCGEDLSKRKESKENYKSTLIKIKDKTMSQENHIEYKVLKEFVSSDGAFVHEEGSVYKPTQDSKRTKNLLRLGYIEKIEPKVELSGQYKPMEGERYYSLNHGITQYFHNSYQNFTNKAIEIGMSFKTEQECQDFIDKMKAYQTIRQDAKGFVPDWGNCNQPKWSGRYNYNDQKFITMLKYCHHDWGQIYFATVDDVEESFTRHRKEWLTVLGVEA